MKRVFVGLVAPIVGAALVSISRADAACCFLFPQDFEVKQPAQTAWITWHPEARVETFTVQPTFEGNAKDFGMVIPTPSRPRLYEMPREFFDELEIFTLLKDPPPGKFRSRPGTPGGFGGGTLGGGGFGGFGGGLASTSPQLRVVEAGLVGSLDYKILLAEESAELFRWLKENGYNFAGGKDTLDHYIKQRWCFTVMKIDPTQQKRKPDGTYSGAVTPTRFVFATSRLVYPLRITQPNVKSETDALFYVQAPFKIDLPGTMSYEPGWTSRWTSAMDLAVRERLTAKELEWLAWVKGYNRPHSPDRTVRPARLQWAKRLDRNDLGFLTGKVKFDRKAPLWKIGRLAVLRGHLREGQWLTKVRKSFRPEEMVGDLNLVPATIGGRPDEMPHTYVLP